MCGAPSDASFLCRATPSAVRSTSATIRSCRATSAGEVKSMRRKGLETEGQASNTRKPACRKWSSVVSASVMFICCMTTNDTQQAVFDVGGPVCGAIQVERCSLCPGKKPPAQLSPRPWRPLRARGCSVSVSLARWAETPRRVINRLDYLPHLVLPHALVQWTIALSASTTSPQTPRSGKAAVNVQSLYAWGYAYGSKPKMARAARRKTRQRRCASSADSRSADSPG